jgi:hypothetical protein
MLDLLHRTRKTACASLLACVVLGVFASGASAAKPVISPVADQRSTLGQAIAPVVVTTNELVTLNVEGEGLPEGLTLKEEPTKTEWRIEGTPKKLGAGTTVTLKAENGANETETETFHWTVEAAPTIANPGPQASTAKQPAIVTIEGTNLNSLTASSTEPLPAGMELKKVSPTIWKIEGSPTTVGASPVTLEATNTAGGAATPVTFEWTVEEASTIAKPPDQAGTVGKAVTQVTITGTNLFLILPPEELPVGLTLTKVTEAEWTITGTPTTVQTTTVRLEAKNKAGGTSAPLTFKWTVTAAQEPPKIETPSKPPETPSKPPETPKAVSAGRLGTMPTQKKGRELWASFLCEVASCKVQVMATITAGKTKFKLHSVRTPIAQGKKMRIALKLTKKQQALIVAALNKRKKVTAALSASIDSSVGRQVTKALVVTVKR